MVERACPEHGRESGCVDPDREPLEEPVRQGNEHNACDDGCEERVLMEHASQARYEHWFDQPILPDQN
jgi:hypothetical protein